jgi:protocatechuate 3,4-dioxygenase beta subunit
MSMSRKNPLFIGIVVVLLIIASRFITINPRGSENQPPMNPNPNNNQTVANCVPTFADGGGPYYKPNSPFRTKIVPENTSGQKLTVSGKVLMNDCKTVMPNAVLDIWQADENGKYQDSWYRGQVRTDSEGNYSFESVLPKGYGEGTGYRPPHIHFKVFVNNQEIITSQMFFPDVTGRSGFDNAFIVKLEKNNSEFKASHNIILPI